MSEAVEPRDGTAPAAAPETCESCHQLPGVPVELERTTSYLVLTDVKPIRGVWCPQCARNRALKETLWSAVFGWWGIPLGVLAGRSIYKNLSAMATAGKAPGPVVSTFAIASLLIPAAMIFSVVAAVQYLTIPETDGEAELPSDYYEALAAAEAALHTRQFTRAVQCYEAAETFYDGDPRLFGNKAVALKQLGRTEEAYEAASRAFRICHHRTRESGDPGNVREVQLYWIQSAELEFQLGHTSSAEDTFRPLVGQSGHATLYASYADLLQRQGRYDEALQVLDTGLGYRWPDGEPLDEEARHSLFEKKMDVYLEMGRPDEAAKIPGNLVTEGPVSIEDYPADNAVVYYEKILAAQGRLADVRRTFAARIAEYEKAIAGYAARRGDRGKSQEEILASLGLAFVLSRQAALEPEYARRVEMYDRGLAATDGRSLECRAGRAMCLLLADQYDEAFAEYAAMAPPDEMSIGLEGIRIVGYYLARRYEDARNLAERVVVSYPALSDLQAIRVVCRGLVDGPAGAEEALAQARDKLSGDPRGMRELLLAEARLQFHWDHVDEAARRYQDAALVYPDRDYRVRLLSARAWLETETPGKADWSFLDDPAVRSDPDVGHRANLLHARLWRGMARWVEGGDPEPEWKALADLDPRDSIEAGWFAVGSARMLLGRMTREEYAAATARVAHGYRPDRDFFVGARLDREGKTDEAAGVYRELIDRPGLREMPRGLARRRLPK